MREKSCLFSAITICSARSRRRAEPVMARFIADYFSHSRPAAAPLGPSTLCLSLKLLTIFYGKKLRRLIGHRYFCLRFWKRRGSFAISGAPRCFRSVYRPHIGYLRRMWRFRLATRNDSHAPRLAAAALMPLARLFEQASSPVFCLPSRASRPRLGAQNAPSSGMDNATRRA